MGSARSAERRTAQEGIGYVINDWQLSGIFTADRAAATRSATLPDRRRQREHHRLAELRRPRGDHRRSGQRLLGRPVPAVQHRRCSGPAVGSVGLESGQNYLIGCADTAGTSRSRATSVLGGSRRIQLRVGPVQRVQRGHLQRPEHDDQLPEPDRSDRDQSAVQPGRLAGPDPVAPEQRRLRRGHRARWARGRCRLQIRFQF